MIEEFESEIMQETARRAVEEFPDLTAEDANRQVSALWYLRKAAMILGWDLYLVHPTGMEVDAFVVGGPNYVATDDVEKVWSPKNG